MIRYDRKDVKSKKVEEKDAEKVVLDKEHMRKIVEIFLEQLKNLKINNVNIVSNINSSIIQLNPQISLEVLSKSLGKKLVSKLEFIKEFYMYNLDNYINKAYGKNVITIQEFPYSFNAGKTENLITYEFII